MNLLDLDVINEFTQSLSLLNHKTEIMLEFIKIIDSFTGIEEAAVFLSKYNIFELEVKMGYPEDIVFVEKLTVAEIATGIKKELMSFPKPRFFQEGQIINGACLGMFKKTSSIKNICLIPLGCTTEILGFVVGKFKNGELPAVNLLKMLANQTYLALKHAFIREEKENLDHIALVLNSLNIQRAFPLFVQCLRNLIEFDHLTITIPDFDKNELLVYAQFPSVNTSSSKIPLLGSASALVISSGSYILEEDLVVSSLFMDSRLLYPADIRTAVRLPLTSKNKIIGTLNLGNKQPAAYGPQHVKLLTDLCLRISSCIENSLMHDVVNKQLQETLKALQGHHLATLEALSTVLDVRDNGTVGHCFRVAEYTVALATKMGVQGTKLDDMRFGALLHDIGKIGIPDSVLFKPGQLNEEEWEIMRKHPLIGYEIASKIESFRGAAPVILYHHERYDGMGYPSGLKGEKVPFGARMFAVADAFDAMTSDRPYRKGMPLEKALAEIKAGSAKQFCPECVNVFLDLDFT